MSYFAAIDPAISIALQHVDWCRRHGMSAREVAANIGAVATTWDEAVWAVAAAWQALPRATRP